MEYSLQNFAGVPLHMDRLAVSSRLTSLKAGVPHKSEPKSESLDEWLAKRLAHLDLEYDPASGIASFRICGMMWVGASMIEEYCWDIYDTRRIARNLQEAERIQGIKDLVIRVDSPGGLARGADVAARAVVDFQARTGIDVRGFVENIGASAAYYAIAGCAGIHAVPDALVGSIGTMAVAVDSSRIFEEYGYDLTLYTGGAPFKGMGSTGTANFINAALGVGFQQSGTGAAYRKGRYYRLKFSLVTYGAGLMYVSAGDGLANLRTPFAPVEGTNVFEGKAGSSGGITTFRANGGTTLSIDNLSIIPLGAVASYVFDPGLGYQIEDKAGLKNHLVLAPSGVTHLRPALTARFTGKITSATGAGNFIVRNGFMLEPGHLITRIQAYSASGGSFTVGEGPGGQAASLVASTTLAAGATADLVLLKQTTASLRMYAALGTAADVQLTVFYEVPRPLP